MRIRKVLTHFMFKFLIIVLILNLTSSCFNSRTYLTPEQTSWNPYKEGQSLVFRSSKDEKDTIYIKEIGLVFPDGIGIVDYNQKLRVSVSHTDPRTNLSDSETYILIIAAKTKENPDYVTFGLRAKGAWFPEEKYDLDKLKELPEIDFSVPYGGFSDVIRVTDKYIRKDTALMIEAIYWSKSKGYVRFDKYDGTSWELIEIIEPE